MAIGRPLKAVSLSQPEVPGPMIIPPETTSLQQGTFPDGLPQDGAITCAATSLQHGTLFPALAGTGISGLPHERPPKTTPAEEG